MSLTTNKFFQLRNLSAEVKNDNGDFTQKLKEPIKLEEGDQIIMNKAILDTRSVDSGKIVLENDTDFRLSFNYYKRFSDIAGVKEYPAGTSPLTTADIDCDPYVLCDKITHSTIVYRLGVIVIDDRGQVSPKNDKFILDVNYTSPDGTDKTAHIEMTRGGYGWASAQNLDILAIDNGSGPEPTQVYRITQQTKDFINSINGNPDTYDPKYTEDPSTSSCIPKTFFHAVVIRAGAYDPDDIAERITRGITLLDSNSDFVSYPTNGNNQLLNNTSASNYTSITNRVWVNMYEDPQSTSPQNHFRYESDTGPVQPYFMGTSQFSLEFDESTQRFKLGFLHFPLYKANASDIVSRFVGINGSSTTARLCSAEGGILLQSLASIDVETGKDTNVWTNSFGFNLSTLCPTPNFIDNTQLTATIPRYNKVNAIGTYLTQGDSNIDVGVVKANSISVQPVVGLETIISQTEPVFAKSNFGQINLTSGYFMIEINGLYNDGLITNTDLKNHIFGIVGRYYENENYTTGTESDALIYQHKGATQYLNSFAIRVLNSDFELAEGLGQDNTIFVQHLKAVQIPQPEKK